MKKKVIVLGGGFAGLAAALELSKNSQLEIVLIDKQNHHVFQPLLYQVASCALALSDIASTLRTILSKQKNISIVFDEVQHIEYQTKTVHGSVKSYQGDYLIVALGARTSYFGNDHWGQHCFGLKSLDDAVALRNHILVALEKAEREEDLQKREQLLTIAIVGGGPTGVELAGAFSELIGESERRNYERVNTREMKIVLIEAGPRLLAPFTEGQSAYTKSKLEQIHIEVSLNTRVNDIRSGKLSLVDANTQEQSVLNAHTIVWAAGVQAADVVTSLSLEKDRGGRVFVDKALALESNQSVFFVGDCAHCIDANERLVPGVAPAAIQMGKHAAKTINADLKGKPRRAFKYFDKGMMAIIGKASAVMRLGQKFKLNGFLAWLIWLFVHIMFLIGFRNKVIVFIEWASAYIYGKRGVRLITREAFSDRRNDEVS